MSVLLLAGILAALSGGADGGVLWERDLSPNEEVFAFGELADLDGDDALEVLLQLGYRDEPSQVVAVDAMTGLERWTVGSPGRSQATAADLDGDGAAEVVVACGDSVVAIDGPSGARIASRRLQGSFLELVSGPMERGADGVVCVAGRGRVSVLTALTGSDLDVRWSVETSRRDGSLDRGFTWPVAVDVDGDGISEVIVADNGGLLRCLSANGDSLWTTSLGACERLNPEGVVSSAAVVADIVPGGGPEVAVGCFAGALVVLDAATGRPLAREHFGLESHERHLSDRLIPAFIRKALAALGEPVNCLLAVDLDGRPGGELVLGCSDGFLYAWGSGRGRPLWRLDTDGDVYDPCLVAGIEGATAPHLIGWDTDGAYVIDGRSGSSVPLFADGGGASSVLVDDLNGDGDLEVVRIGPDGARIAVLSTRLRAWSSGAAR